MALSLHEPHGSCLIDADPGCDPERHLCSGRGGSRPIDPKFKYRWDRTKYYNLLRRAEHQDYFSHLANYGTLAALGPHHRAALSANSNLRGPAIRSEAFARYSVGDRTAYGWRDDAAEGQELARSNIALPSDRGRRPPSLERQEAFRDAKTAKKRASRSRSPEPDSDSDRDNHDLADLAELYRLGLLYDDEHERGSGFGFDAITHDETDLFHINVRPAKRGRKRKAAADDEGWGSHADMRTALDLQLSFAALGDDEALARFLISPDAAELAPDTADVHVGDEEGGGAEAPPPLTVIYELTDAETAEDGTPRTPHLDNYSRPSDTTSTRAHANAPGATDFPDLLSEQSESDHNIDTDENMENADDEEDEDDEGEEEDEDDEREEEDDEEEDNEWAILRQDHEEGDRDDSTEHVADSISIATANPDAWIVLSASDGSKQVRT